MISEFNRFFKSKTLASTYKPTLAKCLLDLGDYSEDEGGQWVKLEGNTYTVDLHFLAARFLRYYHPLRFTFKLRQQATRNRIAIYEILEKYAEAIDEYKWIIDKQSTESINNPILEKAYMVVFFTGQVPSVAYLYYFQNRHFNNQDKIDVPDFHKSIIENYQLSKREWEIIQQISEGYTNGQISENLFISLQTVKDHVSRIYKKTGVKNRVQLVNMIRVLNNS